MIKDTKYLYDAMVAIVGTDKAKKILDEQKRMKDEVQYYSEPHWTCVGCGKIPNECDCQCECKVCQDNREILKNGITSIQNG